MAEPHPHNDRLSHAQCMTRATVVHNEVSRQRDMLLEACELALGTLTAIAPEEIEAKRRIAVAECRS